MSDEKELLAKVERLISEMPQPDQLHRTAAFFAATAKASGLTMNDAMRAFLMFVRTERQAPYARIQVAHDDGQYDDDKWDSLMSDGGPGANGETVQ